MLMTLPAIRQDGGKACKDHKSGGRSITTARGTRAKGHRWQGWGCGDEDVGSILVAFRSGQHTAVTIGLVDAAAEVDDSGDVAVLGDGSKYMGSH